MTSVTFGNSLSDIYDSAFEYCSLGRTIFPASLKYIGDFAFDGNWDLVPVVTRGSYAHTWAKDNGYNYEFR